MLVCKQELCLWPRLVGFSYFDARVSNDVVSVFDAFYVMAF